MDFITYVMYRLCIDVKKTECLYKNCCIRLYGYIRLYKTKNGCTRLRSKPHEVLRFVSCLFQSGKKKRHYIDSCTSEEE